MILPMKKVTIVARQDQETQTLRDLASLAIFHVEEPKQPQNDEIRTLQKDIIYLQNLHNVLPKSSLLEGCDDDRLQSSCKRVEESLEQEKETLTKLRELEQIINALRPWGNFDADLFETVAQNLNAKCYICTRKLYRHLPFTWIIRKKNKCYYLFHIPSRNQTIPSDWVAVSLPEKDLSQLCKQASKLRLKYNFLQKERRAWHVESAVIATAIKRKQEDLLFAEAKSQIRRDGKLCWLTGYVPRKNIKVLSTHASQKGWAVLTREPKENDPVPTALSKGKVLDTVQPVFNIFGTVPGYYEYDFRILFFLFFSLFFALLIGDAGYSSLFFLVTGFIMIRLLFRQQQLPRILILVSALSTAGILWGGLTNNWFASQSLSGLIGLDRFSFSSFSVFNSTSKYIIMFFCILIGFTHLVLARIWTMLRLLRRKSLRFLGELGWLCILTGLLFIVLAMVVSSTRFPIPNFTWPLIFIGLALNVLFAQQQDKHFFHGVLKGTASIYTLSLDALGAFGDIISYIRLYAVGLAGLEVARNFNLMASGIIESSQSTVSFVLAGLVLLGGHSLNIVMGLLSVAVHGIRLNMLEFSRHLGMEWNGIMYRPLRTNYFSEQDLEKIDKHKVKQYNKGVQV